MNTRVHGSTTARLLALITAAPLAISLAGCVGPHHNYPPIPGTPLAVNNPNAPPVDDLMILSLRWLVKKYPPALAGPGVAGEPALAINLPAGVRNDVYWRVAREVSDKAVPLSREAVGRLPIYHIEQLRVREGRADVTVLRPRQELGIGPGGQPVYEGITLRIEGGFSPWRIVRWQTWEPGVIPTPDLYFCPPEGGEPAEPAPQEPAPAGVELVPPSDGGGEG